MPRKQNVVTFPVNSLTTTDAITVKESGWFDTSDFQWTDVTVKDTEFMPIAAFNTVLPSYNVYSDRAFMTELLAEIKGLRADMRALTVAVEQSAQDAAPEQADRDISDEHVLSETAEMLKAQGRLYPSEIASALGVEYERVERALRQLEAGGLASPQQDDQQ